MSYIWTQPQLVYLVKLYEEHQNLYNTKHRFYYIRHKREKSLQKIEAEMLKIRSHVTIDEIKSKIKSIRTQYLAERRKIKRMKNKNSTEEMYEPKYWLYDQLQFLDRHTRHTSDKAESTLNSPADNTLQFKQEQIDAVDTEYNDLVEEEEEISYLENAYPEVTIDSGNSPSGSPTSGPNENAVKIIVPNQKEKKRASDNDVLYRACLSASEELEDADDEATAFVKFVAAQTNELKKEDFDVYKQCQYKILQTLREGYEEIKCRLNDKAAVPNEPYL